MKTIANTLQRRQLLEQALNELSQLKKEAFSVFNNRIPRNKINEMITSWEELDYWNIRHEGEVVPHFYMQDFLEIERIFSEVESARINRKEFAAALAESREAIEGCIKEIAFLLSKEEQVLNNFYDEFSKNMGDLTFIFEEPRVKQAILDKLLKSNV